MRVSERNRHRPPNPGEARDVAIALPGDVAGGVADAKDRVEQELDRAAPRPDDEIGAGNGVGERAARVAPHLLHAEQHRDAERDGEQGQPRRDAAVQHAEQRQPNDGHQSSGPGEFTGPRLRTHPGQRYRRRQGTYRSEPTRDAGVCPDSRLPAHFRHPGRHRFVVRPFQASTPASRVVQLREGHPAIEQDAKPRVVAREQQRRARLVALRGQEVQESLAGAFVEGGCRLVGDDQLRCPDERPRHGHALLLADAEVGDRPREQIVPVESEPGEQAARLGFGWPRPRGGPLAPPAREPAREGDVVDHGQVRHQVEHLEHEADVVGAKPVPPASPASPRSPAPRIRTVPSRGVDTPPSRLNSVLLPLPLGPSMNTRSPAATSKRAMSSTSF